MADVEATFGRTNAVTNPYSGVPPTLPRWHPLNVLWRCLYMGIALYGINYFKAYHALLHSPNVKHEWFKIGLAATVGKSFL